MADLPIDAEARRLDDYQWLTSPAAQPWLDLAAQTPSATAAQVARLRTSLSPERTHLVLEQAALRVRGRAKFASADRMFFSALGLEQATDAIVAAHKAARFSAGTKILDLCCGIGGDLLALAARGETVGVDRDGVIALLARANAAAVDPARVPEVRVADVCQLDLADCDAWHIDPDRRPAGRRTTRVELHEPSLATIEQLRAQNPHAAIKLAPAARADETWLREAELEWISRARECRQLVAWFGSLAVHPGQRRASVLTTPDGAARSIVGVPFENPPATGRIDRFVFEPDAAVLAAGLDGRLAHELEIVPITTGVAYYTADRARIDPAIASFEVLEVLPLRAKPLKDLLRVRGIGRLEIKKRGVETDPVELRRQLQLTGDEEATLLLVRISNRVTAILARRMASS